MVSKPAASAARAIGTRWSTGNIGNATVLRISHLRSWHLRRRAAPATLGTRGVGAQGLMPRSCVPPLGLQVRQAEREVRLLEPAVDLEDLARHEAGGG